MKLKKPLLYASFLWTAITFTNCDEGRIYADDSVIDSNGLTVHVTASLHDFEDWSNGYSLAVAGFADGDEYALISKNLLPDADGNVETTITNIPSAASTVELCVVDRLRRRVATFYSLIDVPSSGTLEMEAGNLDISQFGVIQRDIFNTTCVQCHGGAGYAAANLNLQEGNSFAQLMGVASTKQPDMMRIAPGDPDNSLLYRILSTNESSGWRYDHSVEVLSPVALSLIHSYISGLDAY